jgi:hypothetical protein
MNFGEGLGAMIFSKNFGKRGGAIALLEAYGGKLRAMPNNYEY